jgi:hypothetical protein
MVMHYDPFLMMMTVLMAASAAVLLGLGMRANKHEAKDKTEAMTLKRQGQCDGEHFGHPLTRDDNSM